MTPTQASNVLACYIAADIPAFIHGAPGAGKSDSVRMLARALNWNIFDIRALLLEAVEIKGVPGIVEGRTRFAMPDFLPRADRDGEHGILFLDELNAAPMSVQAALFQLVLDRRLMDYELPPGWRIIAAGNRQSDRAAANRMPSALANRFAHVDYEPDLDSWLAWAEGKAESNLRADCLNMPVTAGIPEMLKAFHLWSAKRGQNFLHQMDAAKELRAFPTPRSNAMLAKVWAAPRDIFPALATGLVGESMTVELLGFLKAAQDLPSYAEIARDPDGARLPLEPSGKFAVAQMVARAMDHGTLAAAARYMARLGGDWLSMGMLDSAKRDGSLKSNPIWTQWAIANQHVDM